MDIRVLGKESLARLGHATGLNRVGLELQKRREHPFIRAVNYHDTPEHERDAFEAQLRYYAEHFEPVGLEDLRAFAAGSWPHSRPGLLLSFDDGLASNHRVAAPLLDRYGFVGFFSVPTGFVDTPPAEQRDWADAHDIIVRGDAGPDGRLAMSWDEIRELSRRHVICSHTVNHVRFRSEVEPAVLEQETVLSRARLEEELGRGVDVFTWVGGEEESYSATAAEMIRKAGYETGLTTNCAPFRIGDDLMAVERVNVETTNSDAMLTLHLSGFYDWMYRAKRGRVAALIGARRRGAQAARTIGV